MAEHLLDEADVGSAFEHQRRHRVAEQVAGPALADLRCLHVVRDVWLRRFELERFARVGQEDGVVVRLGDQLRTGFVEVLVIQASARSPIGIMRSLLALCPGGSAPCRRRSPRRRP